jgi:hypothetical protein
VSERTLAHELEIMDVKAAFHAALATRDKFSILRFNTWPLLYQFESSRPGYGGNVLVKPDGFIQIHEQEAGGAAFSHDYFLELDRSSEHQDRLIARAEAYREYYNSGGYAVRNGAPRTEFKEHHFRVLIVLKTAERRNNTAERLAQNTPPILRQTWLTTFDEVTTNPTGRLLRSQTVTVSFTKPANLLAETNFFVRSTTDVSAQSSKWWSRGESNP